ncbi:MAG: hypothetical protein B7733_06870, partial [Myxococcales bacterium FL481]
MPVPAHTVVFSFTNVRRIAPLALAGAAAGLGAVQYAAANPSATIDQVRVVWLENPASAATISWTTDEPGTAHAVLYDTVPRDAEPSAYAFSSQVAENGEYGTLDGWGVGDYYHHGRLAELQPSTRYYFVVQSDEGVSQEYSFVTAPEDDRPFRLLYGGDSRSNWEARRAMNRRISALVDGDVTTLALAHGGDYVNDGESWNQWNAWLDDHQLTMASDRRLLPILPARGNHEGNGRLYNEVFGFPAGQSLDYWTVALGTQVRLIQLDSESSQGGDQRDFLEDELAAAQQRRWIMANYHRPAYPAVKSPGDAKVHWVPLFEEYQVDFVCESDGHALKRTVPVYRDELDAERGIVYVGEGGLGVNQRTPDDGRWYLQSPGMTASTLHVQRFSISADEILYEAIDVEGEIVDSYTGYPRRDGTVILPSPIAVDLLGIGTLEVAFNKALQLDEAENVDNYSIDDGSAPVLDAKLSDDGKLLVISSDEFEPGEHTLVISAAVDLAGQAMSAAASLPFAVESDDDDD